MGIIFFVQTLYEPETNKNNTLKFVFCRWFLVSFNCIQLVIPLLVVLIVLLLLFRISVETPTILFCDFSQSHHTNNLFPHVVSHSLFTKNVIFVATDTADRYKKNLSQLKVINCYSRPAPVTWNGHHFMHEVTCLNSQ